MPMPWFRLYSETLTDHKIRRAARLSGLDRMAVVGFWCGMLCLANDSPERGSLLYPEGAAMAAADIAAEVGTDADTGQQLLEIFISLDMLRFVRERYVVVNWCRRQFVSDDSTERVRQWRERKRAEGDEQGGDDDEDPLNGNVDETLSQYSGNIPASVSVSLSESESLTEDLIKPEQIPKYDSKIPLHLQDDTRPVAVQIYTHMTRCNPPPGTPAWNAIAALPDDAASLEKWRAAIDEWVLRGYKRNNVAGMLDWYTNGVPARGSPREQKTKQKQAGWYTEYTDHIQR